MKDLPPHVLYPLCIHEVENLVPSQLIKTIGKGRVNMEQGIKLISQMQQIKGGEPLLYYDLKNGFPYIKGASKRAYWKEVLLALDGDEGAMPPEKKAEGMVNSQPLFFPPLSGKLLQYVMGKVEDMENENAIGDLQIDNYLKEIWDNIGMLLLTWGYVNDPLRV